MLNLEGRELGGCRLIRKIGEGGMGEVYLAEQIRVGSRQVAVKVMRPDPGDYGAKAAEDAMRRFEREVAILGAASHPNILPIYDSGVEDDYFYIVMQYAADGSLADSIRGRSPRKLTLPLDAQTTTEIVTQVASALQYTHDHNIVHRDVKPANVLTQVAPDGQWRMLLADFGVARGLDTTSQRTQVTGTFTYMAPEQFSGQFSPATDQYALAVMTYQLLAGRPPFEGELGAVMRGHMYEQPPALNPPVPAGVEAAVMKALAKEPEKRFKTVTEYAQALRTPSSQEVGPPTLPAGFASPPLAPVGQASRWPSGDSTKGPEKAPPQRGGLGRAWLVALAAVVLLVSVAGVGAYVNNQNQAQLNAQETATADARLTQTAGAPTVTPTATQAPITPGVTVTSAPAVTPLPTGVGALVFDSAAPLCDAGDPVAWTKNGAALTTCPGGSQVGLTSSTQGVLACVSAQEQAQANGFIAATVSSQSGNVELGFRQGFGDTSGSEIKITGYYLAVNAQQGQYVIYSVDRTGHVTYLAQSALPAQPPATFQMAALFNGNTITAFVNGQALQSVQDSTYGKGWVAACTDGSATFSHVRLYDATQ
jgi:tRNA A-37 threonylcarbamoyl transferase component Bud32